MTNSVAAIAGTYDKQYLTLLDLSKAVASHQDLPELLHDLAGRLRDFFDLRFIGVMLHDPAHDALSLRVLETHGPDLPDMPSEFPIEGSMSGWVWKNQRPFVTGAVQKEIGRFPLARLLYDSSVRSVCIVPLTTAHHRLGVLTIGSDKPEVYEHLDLEFAQLIAAQIAVAAEFQCYRRKLQRERDRSELLLEINNMLISNLNLRELLSAISTCLRRVVPHDLAGFALCDGGRGESDVSSFEFPENEHVFFDDALVAIEDSPVRLACSAGRPVLSTVSDVDGQFGKRFSAAGLESACTVPLFAREKALGILCIASRQKDAFAESDVELLGQVAKQVAIAVENALAFSEIDALKSNLEKEKLYLEEEIRTEYNFEEIVGRSQILQRVLQAAETVASTNSTVLVYGETGTGKELLARAIHNLSQRRDRTMVKVNCAAIPTGLLESELFGHERGAFTGAIERRIGRFELAHNGTIFLDEVEDIPLELQPKLLRVLQEQEFERLGSSRTIRVDARVIAATNVDLTQLVAEKRFRSDLFYRLNVFPISLPSLRERPEDIPLLVRFFTSKFAQRMKKPIERIPAETMAALTRYRWPGNIRELQNLIERAVILTRGPSLEIPLAELRTSADSVAPEEDGGTTLEEIERAHIQRVLRETNWVIGGPAGAATRLGINRTTLNNRLRKLGISRPRG